MTYEDDHSIYIYILPITFSLADAMTVYNNSYIKIDSECIICYEDFQTNQYIEFLVIIKCSHIMCINCYQKLAQYKDFGKHNKFPTAYDHNKYPTMSNIISDDILKNSMENSFK